MMDPVAKLIELAGPRPRVLVAFSGGVDSTVLAFQLQKHRRKLGALRLAHVDHGLQRDSVKWAEHCAQIAKSWRVPFVSLRANITRSSGVSPEAAAREARYTLLAGSMERDEVLATAQHRDDQVETLLLQLMRGAGVAGLAAMPAIAAFGPGRIARPLLGVTRAELEAVARKAGLRWIEDPSNTDTRFSRNFLRHRLMPLIRDHWPGAEAALARTAAHMSEASALLRERGEQDLATAADGNGLGVNALRALPIVRRRNALRAFIACAGVELPDTSRLNEIATALLAARADAQPEVRWSNVCMQRRGGRLELHVVREAARIFVAKSWRCHDERRLILEDGQTFELVDDAQGPIDLDRLPRVLEVRARAGGETLRPGPLARTQTLKALLQAANVPVDERAQIPLLFARERLIAAGERWVDASIAANVKSRRRARLRLRRAR